MSSAVSLLDSQTRVSPGTFFPQLGGGGGGGGSSTITATYTLQVSSIVSIIPGSAPVANNGFDFPLGANLAFVGGGIPDIEFTNSNGALNGVSSINGAPYPPAGSSSGKVSVGAGNFYVPPTGDPVTLASFSTVAFHQYRLSIPYLKIQNQPAGVPALGAWSDLSVDVAVKPAYLDTFDMAMVSTIENDLQKAPVYTFVASGASHNLIATGSLSNTLSTAVTLGGPMYLEDMGLTTSFPNVG